MKTTHYKLAGSVFILLHASACAFVEQKVPLDPPKLQNAKAPGNGETVYLSLFRDSREEPNLLGRVKNAYGVPMARVTTTDKGDLWISNGLKLGLEDAGYKVETLGAGQAAPVGGVSVTGKVTKIESDTTPGMFSVGLHGKVVSDISIARQGAKEVNATVVGLANTDVSIPGAEERRESLRNAITDFVTKAVDEIKQAINSWKK